jgi:hypothetical protein
MTKFALAVALLLGLTVLAACSTPSATPSAASGATISSATPAQAAAADGSAAHPLAFGQTWGNDNQIKVTLGAPAPYTPSGSRRSFPAAARPAPSLSTSPSPCRPASARRSPPCC